MAQKPSDETIDLTPLHTWLATDAAHAAGVPALLEGVCNRAVDAGLLLSSASLEVAALNPLLAKITVDWNADSGRAAERFVFHTGLGASLPGLAEPAAPSEQGTVTEIGFSDGSKHLLHWQGADQTAHRALHELAARLAMPLEVLVQRDTLRVVAETYLGRRSAARVLEGAMTRGTGETIDAVLWASDIRNFTELSGHLPGEQVIELLNAYFERQAGPIKAFGGEVLKFIGDGLLAIFPTLDDAKAAADRALKAVRSARGAIETDRERRRAAGEPEPDFGVALHVGPVIYGNIGAPDRLDFTVIGPTVNHASRLEGWCKRLGVPVLVSGELARLIDEPLVALPPVALQGIAEPVEIATLPEYAPTD
ncbi:MAG: adenylate/guanylate cyclase domain-containing protein [Pseudomonadota bacterium]